MKRKEQRQYVNVVVAQVKQSILEKLAAGKIPEEWDGHELHQLLADKFTENTTLGRSLRSWGAPGRKRRSAYRNTVLVNNL